MPGLSVDGGRAWCSRTLTGLLCDLGPRPALSGPQGSPCTLTGGDGVCQMILRDFPVPFLPRSCPEQCGGCRTPLPASRAIDTTRCPTPCVPTDPPCALQMPVPRALHSAHHLSLAQRLSTDWPVDLVTAAIPRATAAAAILGAGGRGRARPMPPTGDRASQAQGFGQGQKGTVLD